MALRHPLLAALICATVCGAARADRSRLGDEADVVEAGDCELEFALERKKMARQAVLERKRALQLGCGIGWQTELAATLEHKRDDEGRAHGFALEAKTALHERRGDVGWSLVYGVERERDGTAGWRTHTLFLSTEVTFEPTPTWLLEARIGTARDRSARRDSTPWALGIEHALTNRLELRAALEGTDRRRPEWRLGMRLGLWPEDVALSLEYGAGTGAARERSAGVAVSVEF